MGKFQFNVNLTASKILAFLIVILAGSLGYFGLLTTEINVAFSIAAALMGVRTVAAQVRLNRQGKPTIVAEEPVEPTGKTNPI